VPARAEASEGARLSGDAASVAWARCCGASPGRSRSGQGLEELGWVRPETVRAPDGGRPTVRFRLNPRLLAGRHDQSRRPPKNRHGLSP
jgi:hypothetical protein